jgi:hypothetical protein
MTIETMKITNICPSDYVLFALVLRSKARGLAQHGSPPGWLKESDPAGVILYVMDGPYRLHFSYHTGSLTGAAQLRANGISRCCYIINVHNHPA